MLKVELAYLPSHQKLISGITLFIKKKRETLHSSAEIMSQTQTTTATPKQS